jgi:hypothetical protein
LFDRRAFADAPRILLGALSFGVLFAALSLSADLVMEDATRQAERAGTLGAVAFFGYLAVAVYLRDLPDEEP